MRQVYKRQLITTGLIWTVSFLLLSLLYVLLIIPQKKKVEVIKSTVVERNQQYQLIKDADVDAIKAGWQNELEDLKNRFAEFVIEAEESSNLAFDISRILSDIGVSSSASIESPPRSYSEILGSEYLAQVDTRINFLASFNQFAQIINSLERHKPIFFVNSFLISHSKKTESKLGNEASIDLISLVKIPTEEEEIIESTTNQNLSSSSTTASRVYDSVR